VTLYDKGPGSNQCVANRDPARTLTFHFGIATEMNEQEFSFLRRQLKTKRLPFGQAVMLQVRNSDGSTSAVFPFTR
jgi:hypothetical protein